MARVRMLSPAFFKNEDLASLPFEARLLFAGLWGLADREGRLEDRPRRIAVDVFPYDHQLDVDSLLTKLHDAGFIERYVVDGARYLQIVTFLKHQRPHMREAASVIPPAPTKADPAHCLGSAEASPGSPVSVTGNSTCNSDGFCIGDDPVIDPDPESETVSRANGIKPQSPQPAKSQSFKFKGGLYREREIRDLAQSVIQQHGDEPAEQIVDTLQYLARNTKLGEIKRAEATDALKRAFASRQGVA
jgi:hypothetical protein